MSGQELLLDAIDAAAEPATEYERGWRDGHAHAVLEAKAAEHGIYAIFAEQAEVERRRWHVCCRRCRLAGHRAGCSSCEDRTRATFGQSHPDDFKGTGAA